MGRRNVQKDSPRRASAGSTTTTSSSTSQSTAVTATIIKTRMTASSTLRNDCDASRNLYCWNGGTCKSNFRDTPWSPCDCPDGYGGSNCEYAKQKQQQQQQQQPSSQDDKVESDNNGSGSISTSGSSCNLPCAHGGTCVVGEQDWSGIPALQGLFTATNVRGMYCSCSIGFAGLQCEYQIDICEQEQQQDSNQSTNDGSSGSGGGGERICLHGSKCTLNEEQDRASGYHCACANPYHPNAKHEKYFCQHHHAEICSPTTVPEYFESMAVAAFCVNDGKCSDIIRDNEVYPGCVCPPLYTGPHCEFLKPTDDLINLGDGSSSTNDGNRHHSTTHAERIAEKRTALLYVLITMSLLLLVMTFYYLRRRRFRSNGKAGGGGGEEWTPSSLNNNCHASWWWWWRGLLLTRRRHRRKSQDEKVNLQSFRDDGEDLGGVAVSPNGAMLFPSLGSPMKESSHDHGGGRRRHYEDDANDDDDDDDDGFGSSFSKRIGGEECSSATGEGLDRSFESNIYKGELLHDVEIL